MEPIDKNLLEPNGEPEITENFNRIMTRVAATKAAYSKIQSTLAELTQNDAAALETIKEIAVILDEYEKATSEITTLENRISLIKSNQIFMISFYVDDVEFTDKQYVYYGEKATVPEVIPTKEGVVFEGWRANESEDIFDFNTEVTENIVFTPKFTEA